MRMSSPRSARGGRFNAGDFVGCVEKHVGRIVGINNLGAIIGFELKLREQISTAFGGVTEADIADVDIRMVDLTLSYRGHT